MPGSRIVRFTCLTNGRQIRSRCSRISFYNELLRELRTRGKVVIVISHDDKYYHLADKILLLDRGCPAALQRPRPQIDVGVGAFSDTFSLPSHRGEGFGSA